ncbi:MAG: histidinol-phosphatase HisJ family protein [Lachnospiraceae bacterium]|nr:histidinol-phosphatase HisJ family protein [Lachnospiraceae bacterium]
MSILYDYHMHSDFSGDSETPAEKMIRRAMELGLNGICFTEHLDIDAPPGDADFSLDLGAYFPGIKQLREKYRDRLQIGIGMEFGIMPHLSEELAALNQKYPFDFIIVSQHFVRGLDPYYPEYFEGRDERECYEEYFQAEYETLLKFSPQDFDTLGHLDFVVRYGPNKNRYYSYSAYADYIDPILRYLIENGKCLELNTGGYKAGLGEPNPCKSVLARYRELGGELITIGADAHRPVHVAYAFEQARAVLESLGFRYYTVFEQRKGKQIRL